jgi:mono/diheme cytochrome c family protein
MRRLSLTSVWLLAAFCLPAALHAAEEPDAAPVAAAEQTKPEVSAEALAAFRSDVDPLLKQHCLECHTGADPTGGVAFDELFGKANVAADREAWETLAKKLHSGEMPPEGEPTLEPEKRKTITGWIDGQLANSGCGDGRDPGRVTIRRLNRNEYNNTIRDLLGVDFHPADDFPSDDVGYGFDNIGDVLSMPPILLEKYLAAAEKISTRVIGENLTNLVTEDVNGGDVVDGGARILVSSEKEIKTPVRLFGSGDFIFRVKAFGDQVGDEPVRMAVYLDKKLVRKFEVRATNGASQIYEGRLNTRGGKRLITIRFENDFYDESLPSPHDRNLYVESIELTGPYPPTLKKLIPREHTPEDKLLLAREIVSDVMRRAYRRPVTEEEIKRVLALVEMADRDGENFNNCIGLALQAILVSPNFLFRVELDPENPDEIRTLNDFELATRLSYFLWSSMPDDELMTLARLGQLRSGDNLQQQVRRMLADEKSRSLVENFAGQWLQLRNLKLAAPDKGKYPAFDEALRQAMQKETELFFTSVMREDRSVLEFLSADYTFLNERLAAHYGVADVKGEEFRRVSLDPEQRGGVLTQASVLTVTSNPTRTSPVKRGKWVLENLFGTPPPPPPPDVPELKDDGAALTGSLRQRTEQHRANPACAVCHVRMDPLGFGLENFDGIGGWRTKDGDFDIDASGELPGGVTFNGPRELKTILLARQDDFVHCLAEKMLTYALGRGVEYSDRCTVQDIATAVKQNDHKFASMILAIVESDAFQKRRGKRSE